MRKETVEWTIRMLVDLQNRINTDAEYQRAKVWSRPQQALLIDSILRGFDIPKIYVRKRPPGGKLLFDVIDGKQRLTAIWQFLADDFRLPRWVEEFPELGNLCGKRWSQLPDAAQDVLQFASITVSMIEDATKKEVHELFLRLQEGEPLRAAETRNAMIGPVRDFVAGPMVSHPLWPLTGLRKTRHGYDEHAAILLALVTKEGPTALKGADLHDLYENAEFDPDGPLAIRSIALLEELQSIATLGKGVIRTRWGLVDLAIALMRLRHEGQSPSPRTAMAFYKSFEELRLSVASLLSDLPSEIVAKSDSTDEDDEEPIELPKIDPEMLRYHLAFTREGATEENVTQRSDIFYRKLHAYLQGNA